MIDTAGFNDLRGYVKRRVSYARYRVGSTYYETPLNDVEIRSDGTVRIWISIIPGKAVTVSRVELWSNNAELWMHQDCSITINAGQTGILYWFDIKITEKEV
jgi:hypothetical protein